jgi:hypothetical protein
MKKYIFYAMILGICNLQAYTIKIKNKTGFDIKVGAYYVSEKIQREIAGRTVAAVVTVGFSELVSPKGVESMRNQIDSCIKHMKENRTEHYGCYPTMSGGGKEKVINPGETAKFNIGTGCLRVVKAWAINPPTGLLAKDWTADKITSDEGQCLDNTFDIIVKTYDDGSKKLKSIRKK